MRSRVLLSLLFAIAIGGDASGESARQINLEPYRKTVAVRVEVAGQEGLFALDTAGGLTLLTPAFAKRVGCRPWGRITGFRMMGDRLDSPRCDDLSIGVAGNRLRVPVAAVVDVMAFYPKDAQPIDGILALDAFAGKVITIDFPRRILVIESEKSLRSRLATHAAFAVPARIAREAQGRAISMSVGVRTSQGTVWMELDSGNGGTILVNKVYADLFGLSASKEDAQHVSFPLAGDLVVEGDAFTPDMVIDGNIGMPFLKTMIVTFDLANGRVWLARG